MVVHPQLVGRWLPEPARALLLLPVLILFFVFSSFPVSAQPNLAQPPVATQGQMLRIGIYENPPKLFLDEAGNPGGILGELLQEMARL